MGGKAGGLRTYGGAMAIVTGGASGIGRALGQELARRGATVVLADRQAGLAEEVAAGIAERGGTAEAAELDVRDAEAVARLVNRVAEERGRLDYLFNNAGIGVAGEVRHYRPGDWDLVLDVNLRGVAHGVEAAYPLMVRQGFGHLVNTASVTGLLPSPGLAGYSTAKHAVVGMSLAIRAEGADLGVRCSAFCPGAIRTPILEGGVFGESRQEIPPELRAAFWERYRPMDPAAFAREALDAVARNRAIIVIPGRWRLAWWLNRLSPTLGMAMATRQIRRSRAAIAEAIGEPAQR